MRVLFIVNSPDAKFPVDIAQKLADDKKIEIKILPLLGAKSTRYTWWRKLKFCIQTPSLIRTIRSAIKEYQPDIIHTHFWLSDIIGERATRTSPHIKLVSTQHDEVKPTFLITLMKRRAMRRFSQITAISKSVAQFLKSHFKVPGEKILTIYNGIDIDQFIKGAKNDSAWKPTIGFIARLEPIKGGDIFIEALCRLTIRDATMRALVVGDGSQKTKLENRCQQKGITDRVRFLDRQATLIPTFKELDIVVVPSRSEGLSVTILESLAARKLVIASDIGGIPELIMSNHTGLLVRPNHPQALADAIQWAIEHRTEALAIRARGHEWLLSNRATFDLSQTIKKYHTLYASLVI